MKYERIDLLNLAWNMGVPITSKEDLIFFEFDLINNGDLDQADRIDSSVKRDPEVMKQGEIELNKLVKDIHNALFADKSLKGDKVKMESIAMTKANLMLKKATKKTR